MIATLLPRPDPPLPDVASQLAKIWCDVLRIQRVTPDDDIFDLGAHSLLITQIISQVRAAYGVDLSLRDVYDAPTFRLFVALVELRLKSQAASAA